MKEQVTIKTKFALEHNGDPIFKKPYDGSTSEVVNVTAIQLHYQIISLYW